MLGTYVLPRRVVPAALLALALTLSACGQTSQPAAKATEPAKPAATAAPAATTAAAAKPTEAPKPGAPAAGGAAATDQGACTEANATKARPTGRGRFVIGTGGTGGVYFPFGGGLARILTAHLPNTEWTAEVTGGSVDNFKLIHSEQADLGLSTVDSAYDAMRGDAVYKDTGPIKGCTIAVLYQSFVHVVALDGSGIERVEDMKGKRVSVGSAGSSTEGAADRILEAAGLNPMTDVTRDNLSVAESVAAMKDRKIDAFFWIGGLPTAAVTDLVATPNLKVKFLKTDDYVASMRQKYGPVYTAYTLPAGTYSGIEPVAGIGIGNILFANASMNQDLVADILKTIFDNLNEVREIHPEGKVISLETATQGSSIPFHPGAIRYYTEKGVWKP
jgi:uncharacterized protein